MDALTRPTEAEQNRLIQSNMGMVAPIASEFRGRKSIPFEDIVSEGMVGLVEAARKFNPALDVQFSTWATHRIRGSILDFIDSWQEFVPADDDSEEDDDKVHWWAIWSDIPYEGWTNLPASAEDVMIAYQEFADNKVATEAAFLSLSKRERQMIKAHFLRAPRVSLDQIARDHKLSYWRTVELVYAAVKKMRAIVAAYERRTSIRNIIPFPKHVRPLAALANKQA